MCQEPPAIPLRSCAPRRRDVCSRRAHCRYINARLQKILSSTQVPDASVIDAYLTEIAKAYGVEYIPKPASSVQPISATLGIALPMPGTPMPDDLVDEVRALIDTKGCDPAEIRGEFDTPLAMAVVYNAPGCADLLLQRGAPLKWGESEDTVLHAAAGSISP